MRAVGLLMACACTDGLVGDARVVDVADCDALAAAIVDAHGLRFAPAGSLTLRLGGAISSDCHEPLIITHPQGDHLQIVGLGSDPGAHTLNIRHGGHGIEVAAGGLGMLSGLTLKNVIEDSGSGTMGILARDGAVVKLGRNIILSDFPIGVRASYGASVIAPPKEGDSDVLVVSGSTTYGVFVTDGSHVTLPDMCVDMDRDGTCRSPDAPCRAVPDTDGKQRGGVSIRRRSYAHIPDVVVRCAPGNGIGVAEGSYAKVDHAAIHHSGHHGVLATTRSTLYGEGILSSASGEMGFMAENNSTMTIPDAEARGSRRTGFAANQHSVLHALRARAVDNGERAFYAWMRSTIWADTAFFEGNNQRSGEAQSQAILEAAWGSAIRIDDPVTKELVIEICPMTLHPKTQAYVYWQEAFSIARGGDPIDASGKSCIGPGTRGSWWQPSPPNQPAP